MTSTDESWFDRVAAALAAGPKLIRSSAEFNAASDHVLRLLEDSCLLRENHSYPSSAFFAITALEETAKVHLGSFRTGDDPKKRRDDPLYGHSQKHALAVGPTVAMGTRLATAIGEERAAAVINRAASGNLRVVREACLYTERSNDGLQLPCGRVSRQDAQDLLLLAIEAFDDSLVGFTSHSIELGKRADVLFSAVAAEQAVAADEPAAGNSE